jgi:hypothetical protein
LSNLGRRMSKSGRKLWMIDTGVPILYDSASNQLLVCTYTCSGVCTEVSCPYLVLNSLEGRFARWKFLSCNANGSGKRGFKRQQTC